MADRKVGSLTEEDEVFDWETRPDSVPLLKHIIAGKYNAQPIIDLTKQSICIGSCAGVMEHVGMFPLDTIKVSEN